MTLEEQLKQVILSKYKSVSAFSQSIGLSNSTVDSMLNRGLYNAGVGRVMKIFDALGIDTESLAVGRIIYIDGKNGVEIEKAPAPSEDSAGESGKLGRDDVVKVLMSLGFIDEGEDLADSDLLFLEGVVNILEAWFEQRRQGV